MLFDVYGMWSVYCCLVGVFCVRVVCLLGHSFIRLSTHILIATVCVDGVVVVVVVVVVVSMHDARPASAEEALSHPWLVRC